MEPAAPTPTAAARRSAAGILQLGNNAALGAGTAALAVNGGTLDLNGYSPGVGPLSGGGTIDDVAGGGVVGLDPRQRHRQRHFLRDHPEHVRHLSLVVTGSGTQVLSGANTSKGSTTVNGGTLTVSNAAALQKSGVTVNVNNGLGFTVPAATLGSLSGRAT